MGLSGGAVALLVLGLCCLFCCCVGIGLLFVWRWRNSASDPRPAAASRRRAVDVESGKGRHRATPNRRPPPSSSEDDDDDGDEEEGSIREPQRTSRRVSGRVPASPAGAGVMEPARARGPASLGEANAIASAFLSAAKHN